MKKPMRLVKKPAAMLKKTKRVKIPKAPRAAYALGMGTVCSNFFRAGYLESCEA